MNGRTGRQESEAQARALRREVMSIERRTGGILLNRTKVEELLHTQRMLVAIVKAQGRVRIVNAELEALVEGDSLKARREGDSTMLTYAPISPDEVEAEEDSP